LGNRLFLFSQLIENYFRFGREIWIPGFHEYHKFFESTKNKRFYRFPVGNLDIPNPFSKIDTFHAFNRISKVFYHIKFIKFFKVLKSYECENTNIFEIINDKTIKVVLFNGFIFHQNFLNLKNSFNSVKKMFSPSINYLNLIEDPINFLRSKSKIVVGVLIRQTDYREWNQGKCFFTSIEYKNILIRIEQLYPKQDMSFFIATDEEQNEEIFKDLKTFIRVGHPIENLYSLSCCDILIGPSSSYVGWASLYGKVPLFTIQSPNDSPQLSDFILHYS